MTAKVHTAHLEPTSATIAAHLIAEHLTTGLGTDAVIGTPVDELLRWHDVDHRHVTDHLLGHTHSATPAVAPSVDHDAKVHTATLKAIAEGRPVANVDEMCRRAAEITARRARADTDEAAGRPIAPGARVLSPYDRRCLEVAQAVADRATRRARRKAA